MKSERKGGGLVTDYKGRGGKEMDFVGGWRVRKKSGEEV
jgi:hypothetical protein